MRIAVAGTHRNGKTTLVEAVGNVLRDFAMEAEPYEQLLETGDDFIDDQDPEVFVRQLEFQVARMSNAALGQNVIYDRSPLDFVAYVMALDELQLGRRTAVEPVILELAASAMSCLDLIAYVPLRPEKRPHLRTSFRRLVDAQLADLLRNDSLGLMQHGAPAVIELVGSTGRRLEGLLAAVCQDREKHRHGTGS
jgi:deoxyadenosine/deoxycytidine kinase